MSAVKNFKYYIQSSTQVLLNILLNTKEFYARISFLLFVMISSLLGGGGGYFYITQQGTSGGIADSGPNEDRNKVYHSLHF